MNRIVLTLLASVAVVGFASSTYAADLIVSAEPMAPVYEAASGNWDGAYIGAFAGYGWGTLSDPDDVIDFDDQEISVDGWQVGLTAGANVTLAEAIVAGIAGDIAWNNASGAYDPEDFTYNVNWSGSIRGRLGFDGGAFLPYVTAGLAFANATADWDGDVDTQTHIGWTAGAGVEFAVAENVSLDLQYRYSDYGTKTYSINPDTDLSLTSHAVTLGLNWGF